MGTYTPIREQTADEDATMTRLTLFLLKDLALVLNVRSNDE